MRTTSNHSVFRCGVALQFDDTHATRCILAPGHGGRHEARIKRGNPYQSMKWLDGDGRQFISEKTGEWPWIRKVE